MKEIIVYEKCFNYAPNGGYRLLDKTVTDFEFISYTRRDGIGLSGRNEYSIVNENGDGYGLRLDYSNDVICFCKCIDWTLYSTKFKLIIGGLDFNRWYTFRLIKIGSNFSLEIYDGKVIEFINTIALVNAVDNTYTSFDRIAVTGGYVFYSDDITVRKLL